MSRLKAYLVGRDPSCDYPIAHASVSRRHAEVVLPPDGRVYVTDRGSTGGTFVLDGATWKRIRQAYVEPTDRLRFGAHELAAGKLAVLRARGANREGGVGGPAREESRKPMGRSLDRLRRPERKPKTGEVVEQ